MRLSSNWQFSPLAAGVQPIQDVVEYAVQWNLTGIAPLGLTQIGREVLIELFFSHFDGYRTHGNTLSGPSDPGVKLLPSWLQCRCLSTTYEP